MGWIAQLLFFYKDSVGIKYSTNVDMLLNKETKPDGCKNPDNQVRSGRTKAVDSEFVLPALEANPASNTRRVSSGIGISQFSVVHLHNDPRKSIRSYRIVLHATEISQNLRLTLVKKIFYMN